MCKIFTRSIFTVLLFIFLSSFKEAHPTDSPFGGFTMISRTVWELTQVPNIATETGRIKTSLQVADFEPVGLRATANTPLVLNVEQTSGAGLPKLIVGTYDRQTVTTYDLVQGINTITNANGGDLYLQYSSATPSENNKVKVTFQSGYHLMPLYILGATTHQEWLDMLAGDTLSPNVTLVSNRVFIVVSQVKAEAFQQENQDTLLTLMDRVMKAEGDISGLDNSSPLHAPFTRNKLMVLEKSSGNPDATSLGRVRIPSGSINWILSPSYILQNGGWGVFHEFGHHHQHWAWTWSTCIEVCVNIYSLAAKRAIHPNEQGMSTSDWNGIMNYLSQPQASKNFNASSVFLFMRLGLFQQLWLAYGDGFYHTLHKRIREEAPSPSGDEAEMRLFMLMACQISGENLGHFFKTWGLNVNQSVYDEINALGYPAPAIEPSILRENLVASITSPGNNTVFPAGSVIPISATAFGPEAISKVEFFQGTEKLGEDTTAPYDFTWNNVSAGSYALTVKATTKSGVVSTSAASNVILDAVSITSPIENSSFPAGVPIVINASAGNATSPISKVVFYADSVIIGETSTTPYSFSWQNAAKGSYKLTAKAIYQNGDTATSSAVEIIVGGAFPVADAYVRDGGSAAANFGTAAAIVVKKDGNSGFSRISYLKFDLNDFSAPGIAKLRLQIAGAGSTVTGTQWQVWKCDNDSWTETGINWNNKPANVTLLATQPGKKSGFAEWDISNQVIAEINGDKILTLAIVSTVSGQTNDVSFHSREAAGLKPELLFDTYPKITLIQPSNGDTLIEHTAVLIKANASDDQQVDSVKLYVNGEEKTVSAQAPHQWNWENVTPGTYGIRAKVTDDLQHSTWSDSVTVVVVRDSVPPVIIAPPAIMGNPAPGSSSAFINIGTPVVTDNGGVASVINNAPDSFQVGNTTVIWTATDLSGNIATATQIISVQYLKSSFGAVTVFAGPANGNNSSRKIDLQVQLYLNGTLAGTGSLLDQPISGNGLGNCRTFIVPLSSDSITYTPEDLLQIKILARNAGGTENFSIKFWHNADSLDASSKGYARMQKYTPVMPDGNFFYLREGFLLQSSAGNDTTKITRSLSLNYQEIGTWSTAQLAGQMNETLLQYKAIDDASLQVDVLRVKAYPNPSGSEFTLNVYSKSTKEIRVSVSDITGKLIKQMYTTAGQSLRFGQELKAGIYFVEVQQAGKREVIKLIKQ